MFKSLFSIIIKLISSMIQIVLYPVNEIVSAALPDLSEKILWLNNQFLTVFDGISWGLGLIPNSLLIVLIFIILCEISRVTIFISTKAIIFVWCIIRRIKFW